MLEQKGYSISFFFIYNMGLRLIAFKTIWLNNNGIKGILWKKKKKKKKKNINSKVYL